MRMYWFNDRDIKVGIFVNSLDNLVATIEPQCGDWIDLSIPEDKELFIKTWNTIVFISTIEKDFDA